MALAGPTHTRRVWLMRAGMALGAAPMLLSAASARATANTPKSAVGYQFKPNGEQHCGACASFIPGADAQGAGTCKIVDGAIPQNGWCQLFSKR